MSHVCLQVLQMQVQNAEQVARMAAVEECCAQLIEQLKTSKQQWCQTCVENVKLYKKIFELRKALNPGALRQLLRCEACQPCYEA